jgi:hypothetical protein
LWEFLRKWYRKNVNRKWRLLGMENPLKRASSLCLLISIVLGWSLPVHAEDKEAYSEALVAFKEGVLRFEEKQYDKATIAFRRAYELRPNWKIFYNIGQSEAAAKRYGLALVAFEQYMAEGGDDIQESRQKELFDEMERLRRMVGFLEVKGRDGDVVFVDGMERGTVPNVTKLRVSMGKVLVQLKRADQVVLERNVEIIGGEQIVLEEDLAVGQPSTQLREGKRGKKRMWTWLALGVGGVAGIAGGIIGGVSIGKRNDFMDDCGDGTCSNSRKEDRDTVKSLSLSADVLYGVAAVGIVAGIVLFFVEPRIGDKGEKTVVIAPMVSSNGGGVSIGGRF